MKRSRMEPKKLLLPMALKFFANRGKDSSRKKTQQPRKRANPGCSDWTRMKKCPTACEAKSKGCSLTVRRKTVARPTVCPDAPFTAGAGFGTATGTQTGWCACGKKRRQVGRDWNRML